MATRGRKPKPPELKRLKGERADRMNPAPPEAPAGLPDPPAILDAEGKKAWARMVAVLTPTGVLKQSDAEALSLYCDHYSTWVAATKAIRSKGDGGGIVTTAGSGGLKVNPAVSIAREAMAAMQRLLVEFGCTPSSRSRVRADTGPAVDELESF